MRKVKKKREKKKRELNRGQENGQGRGCGRRETEIDEKGGREEGKDLESKERRLLCSASG